MNDTIQNKLITISGIETKLVGTNRTMLRIKDQDNKTYQIWKTKADGTDSIAYKKIEELGGSMAVGKSAEISYKEEEGDYNGKKVVYRTVINLKQSFQPKAQTITNLQKAEASKKSEDEKWTEISKGKVRHGVACEFIRLGAEYTPATISKINKWTEFIMTGNMFNEAEPIKTDEEPLDDVDYLNRIDASKIPF